jgi:hypothetical protein
LSKAATTISRLAPGGQAADHLINGLLGHQNLAQVGVATLADTQKTGLASGRELPRHNPEPGRELTTLTEGGAVADGGDDSGGDDRSDAP